MKRLALPTICLALAALSASGCVYKMSIQQGNYLVTDSVAQLKEGMTRSQVRFLLGTPMVPVAFDDSRWDYYYFFSSRVYRQPLKRRLTVYFQDERVQRFENQGVPTQADLTDLERDLKKAVAATKKNQPKRKHGEEPPADAGSATTPGPETTTGPQTTSGSPSKADAPPDPVPPSQPLPAPAGTPSGPH
jgi:outer membrane protein assembly factor BamE